LHTALTVKLTCCAPFGLQAFAHAVPFTWNTFPSSLYLTNSYSSFRSQLKCHFWEASLTPPQTMVGAPSMRTIVLYTYPWWFFIVPYYLAAYLPN
jgi:hypothetical protein